MPQRLTWIAVLLLASGVSAWCQLPTAPRSQMPSGRPQRSLPPLSHGKSEPKSPSPDAREPQTRKDLSASLQLLSSRLDFGNILPNDSPELTSSPAQLLVFSPKGECLVGVVTPDPSSPLELVQACGESTGPAAGIPLAWELRWRCAGGTWTEWAPAQSQQTTVGRPAGLWWIVGVGKAISSYEAELRCRTKITATSPAGRYVFSQALSAAIWTAPVPSVACPVSSSKSSGPCAIAAGAARRDGSRGLRR